MKRLLLFLLLSGIPWIFMSGQTINHWETAIFRTDTWRYRIGFSEPGENWKTLSFDDSSWSEGPGGFGYGDDDDNTIIPECISVCMRIKFNISDTAELLSAILNMDYDDGFIAYLNDKEIVRSGVQGIHPPFDRLTEEHEAAMYKGEPPESFFLNRKKLRSVLLPGENLLAIEVHNDSGTSDDLSSNAWLSFGIAGEDNIYRQVPDWFTPVSEFTSSNLPVVVVNTQSGEEIMNEPKITADMKIIYNGKGQISNVSDPGNIYTGKAGIEIRGKYSASLPQKPYGFETRDGAGNKLNVPILGMPEENDWILTANYNDKVFLRNYLAFELFRKMGHYAPRTLFCEVVTNEQYRGIYLLGEKIKQDKNRVDIAKLNRDENSGDNLTGGYIFVNDYFTESDSWQSNYSPLNRPGGDVHFVYYDPGPDELTATQKTYLKDFVGSFEDILYSSGFKDHSKGYRAYLDINSFVDYFIVGEISRNVDAYKKSRFYFKDKDRNGGLIHSGPPWDFDWAWKDITEDCIHFNQTDGSGWAYRVNDCIDWPIPPSWEIRLLEDNEFANKINARYFKLRKTILGETYLNHVIDSVASLLNEAQERHYRKWPILGINVGTGEYGEQPGTFGGEIEKFKDWITRRLAWLDANMVGDSISIDEENSAIIRVFPNPADNTLHVESDEIISRITIFNLTGNSILENTGSIEFATTIDITQHKPGLYIIRIYLVSGEVLCQRFVKK
jgi:hypothetical protein